MFKAAFGGGFARKEIRMDKNEKFEQIIKNIDKSYTDYEEMNNLEGSVLPSRASIQEMAGEFMALIFPGFYTNEFAEITDSSAYIRKKCEKLSDMLAQEIGKGVKYNCKVGRAHCALDEAGEVALLVATELLENIPAIRELAYADATATFKHDPAARSIYDVVLSYPGLEALTIYRFAHFLYQRGVPFIPRMLTEFLHGKTGIDINPGASIGRGVFIDHGTGVVIGETCVVGDNVKIYQGVTLGAMSLKKNPKNKKRHPTIEDDVTIYSGATILGGETIVGKGSVIGGNVWLVQSVPPNSKIYMEAPQLTCKNCNLDINCQTNDEKTSCPRTGMAIEE